MPKCNSAIIHQPPITYYSQSPIRSFIRRYQMFALHPHRYSNHAARNLYLLYRRTLSQTSIPYDKARLELCAYRLCSWIRIHNNPSFPSVNMQHFASLSAQEQTRLRLDIIPIRTH